MYVFRYNHAYYYAPTHRPNLQTPILTFTSYTKRPDTHSHFHTTHSFSTHPFSHSPYTPNLQAPIFTFTTHTITFHTPILTFTSYTHFPDTHSHTSRTHFPDTHSHTHLKHPQANRPSTHHRRTAIINTTTPTASPNTPIYNTLIHLIRHSGLYPRRGTFQRLCLRLSNEEDFCDRCFDQTTTDHSIKIDQNRSSAASFYVA